LLTSIIYAYIIGVVIVLVLFLNNLNRFEHNESYSGNKFYYFDDYIVKLVGDDIHFGVARGGHSGGYWFIPTITSFDNRIEFRGSIRYIGPDGEK
jgi:hypothetical protein